VGRSAAVHCANRFHLRAHGVLRGAHVAHRCAEVPVIKFTIPIRVDNPLNGPQGRSRGAMLGKAAKRKKQRQVAFLCMRAAAPPAGYMNAGVVGYSRRTKGPSLLPGRVVVLRRVSPRALDGDGLQAALKSVRDGIADALGINDGSDAVTWKYEWRRGGSRFYAVEVEILPQQEQAETREAMCP
jgi:hypothetical protein